MALTKPEPPIKVDIWPAPEFWGEVRCPWNPFPPGSEWGDEIDRQYNRRTRRRPSRYRPFSNGDRADG